MKLKETSRFYVLDNLNIEIPALEKDAEGKLRGGFCSVKTFGLEGASGDIGFLCSGGGCSGDGCTGNGCSSAGAKCNGKKCNHLTPDPTPPTPPTPPTDEGENPTPSDGDTGMIGLSMIF